MMLFAALIAVGALASCALAQGDGTTVQIPQGLVAGSLSSGVRQFIGIPYAVADRWQPPQPPPSLNSTLQATNFGDSCVQAIGASSQEFLTLIGLGNQKVQESENCLSVNIWAPSVERKQGAAVMLWIYGGSFTFGTSNTDYYVGQNIVQNNDDVLVVSFNYRLNIFGAPNAPQLMSSSESSNFGLLDLRAAVEWVHANIAAFGGDPERIVLFGESAGSLSADAYTYANPTDTIVKGVIQESGSLAGNTLLAPQANVTKADSWNQIAKAVGCGSDPTSQQLSCMKAVPFRTLADSVVKAGDAFAPVPDGITYFFDTNARSSAGNFLHVPVLVGNNGNEGDIFVVAAEEVNIGITIPGLTTIGSDAVTKLVFTCPSGTTAGDRTKAGVPTWRYRYESVFPDATPRKDLRCFHTAEIPMVFGTYNSSILPVASTSTEIALSAYMQSAWVAFARDPAQGLTNFGWPTYDPSTNSLVQLGNSANASGVTFTSGSSFDDACDFSEDTAAVAEKLLGLTGGIL